MGFQLSYMSCTLLLVCLLVSKSLQASVENCTAEADPTEQCYMVSFTRSIFEGHDSEVTRESSKEFFLLTIYSNTENTNSLKGYNLTVNTRCSGAEAFFSIEQRTTKVPQSTCQAEVMSCGSTMASILLDVIPDTISDDVFYAQVRFALPSSDFGILIQPVFEGSSSDLYNSIKTTPNFAAVNIDTLESSEKVSDCTVTVAPGPVEPVVRPTAMDVVAMAVVFAVGLFIAAAAAKLFTYWDKIRPSKKVSEAGVELNQKSNNSSGETSGHYEKQQMA